MSRRFHQLAGSSRSLCLRAFGIHEHDRLKPIAYITLVAALHSDPYMRRGVDWTYSTFGDRAFSAAGPVFHHTKTLTYRTVNTRDC